VSTGNQEIEAGNYRFLYIGGLHRSGTSTVFRCLREHPLISGFNDTGATEEEGQHLQSVYPPATAYGGPGRFGFHPEAHLTEASDLATADNRLRLFEEWKAYWDLAKPVLLEKSPPNLIRARFLQELFPNTYFVIVTRHPIAVSYATQKWSYTSLAELIEHWLVCHEKFRQDEQHLRRLLVLRYEDFVEQPQTALRRIYSFLSLPDHSNPIEVREDANEQYLNLWRTGQDGPPSEDRIDTDRIKSQFERRVAAFGYSLDV
jgi:Sulfotransferase family